MLGAVVVALTLLAACGGGDADEATETPTATPQTAATTPPAPTATTAPTPTPAPTATPEPDFDFSAIPPIVEGFIADNELNGAGLIVVHRDDGVIFHEHWGEFDEDRISLIASSSKMITAGVLLHLQDQGLIDIDAPVADSVDWGAGNPEITVAHLLSNSSGLPGLIPDPGYVPYQCQWLFTTTLSECAASVFTTADDDADVVPPDTEFRYGGAQWQVAGAVAEAVSGKSWDQLIDEIYVQPCGLAALGYNNQALQLGAVGFDYPVAFGGDPASMVPSENPNLEGGAYVTTGDYGALLLMHLRDGFCGDTQVLSIEALATMHTDRLASYGGDAWSPDTGYGMGWWVDRTTGRITDGGAYGSHPWLDLEDGYGAFLLIEANSRLGNELGGLLYDPVEAAIVG